MTTTTTRKRTTKTKTTTDRRPGKGERAAALTPRRKERGIALILVLWTFAAIAVLAAEFARAMHDEAASASNFKESTRARLVAIAGLNEAILAMKTVREYGDKSLEETEEEDPENPDPVRSLSHGDGQWVKAEFRGHPYEVRVVDEAGKIGINYADGAQLRIILGNLDLDEDQVETIADSIIDWRDADDLHQTNGAETEYYESLDRPYRAKNAFFDSIEELLLVKGVTRDAFYGIDGMPGLREVFSVFAQPKVNLKSVTPAVMQALGGLDADAAAEFAQLRRDIATGGAAIDELRNLLDAAGAGTRNQVPQDITVEARVYDATGTTILAHVGAVMNLSSGGDELKLYRWYDSIFEEDDQPGGQPSEDTAS